MFLPIFRTGVYVKGSAAEKAGHSHSGSGYGSVPAHVKIANMDGMEMVA